MKKISLFVLLLNCFICTNCQNKQHTANDKSNSCGFQNDDVIDLGIGIAVWDYDCDKNIVIFNDSLLTKKTYDFNVCNNNKNDVCPLFYKPDYGIYHFIVTKLSTKWYEIIYNADKKGYISANSVFQFVDWHTFLIDYSTGIREKGQKTIYSIQSVNGDIVSVVEEENNITNKLRWKDKNKLLIDIFSLE
ncbi:MAG: hypothetical protein LBQ84_01540 [Flavobacteriaceae bacterium]|jgi:hypothetical protein|nr:hypothetical protein [Flavobacteriaceae bacterium]